MQQHATLRKNLLLKNIKRVTKKQNKTKETHPFSSIPPDYRSKVGRTPQRKIHISYLILKSNVDFVAKTTSISRRRMQHRSSRLIEPHPSVQDYHQNTFWFQKLLYGCAFNTERNTKSVFCLRFAVVLLNFFKFEMLHAHLTEHLRHYTQIEHI